MTPSELAALIVAALSKEADDHANAQTALVSVSIEMLGADAIDQFAVRLERKTKTLIFVSAEALAKDGSRIASAASIHKIGAL